MTADEAIGVVTAVGVGTALIVTGWKQGVQLAKTGKALIDTAKTLRTQGLTASAIKTYMTPVSGNKGFLSAHEGGAHRGHTKLKHVNVTDNDLYSRMSAPGAPTGGASRFQNQAQAETVIAQIFKDNQAGIAEWIKLSGPKSKTEFSLNSSIGPTGRHLTSSTGMIQEVSGAKIVLQKISQDDFRIITSYPTP